VAARIIADVVLLSEAIVSVHPRAAATPYRQSTSPCRSIAKPIAIRTRCRIGSHTREKPKKFQGIPAECGRSELTRFALARSLHWCPANGPGQVFRRRLVMLNSITNKIRISIVAIALFLVAGSTFAIPADAAQGLSVSFRSSSRYAYSEGFRVGYREGYGDGREDARRDRRFDGRKRSFSRGSDSAFRAGFENGYERGYMLGYRSIRRHWDNDDWRDRRDDRRDRRDRRDNDDH